ncbi:LLM class F420-dependent oxidoreductase [Actinomycetospora termitidis]|uniref:LLM class F420-dependent oxidoreductase n=1 Tax=Actinomycetospora termitidis TaxID=3053470 RepID=A0ABT7MGS6_9PSEU|nr:LLM class F420-dependent oxidoreductase [Actinomycetospora sp. Odt1-22]MDL5158548.1 LLM class F420-dependent oxidoreductase [Actinomycetospora sp. Odt1-22]
MIGTAGNPRDVQHGIMMFPTDYAIDPATLAKEVEDRGFDSLWFPEHSHIPVSRESPYPGGGDLPRMYVHTYDPFVALSWAAAATTTLKVATGICLLIQRDPIHTAKEVASLDRLSGGRFLFGIGGGWNREEMADHGTNPKTRMRRLGEQVEAMKALWTQEEAEFDGEFVQFERSWAWPKPVTQPHPPVIVGGMGPTVEDRILEFGDEWLPQRVGPDNVEEFIDRAEKLQQRAADAGRGRIPMSLFGAETSDEAADAYRRAGLDRAIYGVSSSDRDTVLKELDELAPLVSR